jgi:hypothetical protein
MLTILLRQATSKTAEGSVCVGLLPVKDGYEARFSAVGTKTSPY